METAEFMLQGGRNIYAVLMCHQSIEKALKGLYYEKLNKIPPKIHNLLTLITSSGIKPPEDILYWIANINEANISTRYFENFFEVQKLYPDTKVQRMLTDGNEVMKWIKSKL